MKEIKAYIKKHKLDEVICELRMVEGLSGLSVMESCGYGAGWGGDQSQQLDCRPGIKVEVVCHDNLADMVVAAIEKAAHTGLKGDGKIYVSHIEQAVRISTGERGEGAI